LLPFTSRSQDLWPKQVLHPEMVASNDIFGMPGSVGREASSILTRLVESDSEPEQDCSALAGSVENSKPEGTLRKRFYIFFVARDEEGQLRKISIPLHYLYVLLAGAAIGILSLTGIASSYTRMLYKVSQFNRLRTEQDELKGRYTHLEQVAKERDIQMASLGSLAGEVSALYGLKSDPGMVSGSPDEIQDAAVHSSMDQLYALRHTALTGAATVGISLGLTKNATTADWIRANGTPNLWPVEGQITGSFGARIDPIN
jgi:hypothetical protein